MKIILDARLMAHGVGRCIEEWGIHLAKIDPDNEYFVLIPQGCQDHWSIGLAKNFHPLAVKSAVYSIAEQFELPTVIKQVGADVFHATSYPSPMRCTCPLVVTIHDQIPKVSRSYLAQSSGLKGFVARTYFHFMNDYAIRASAHILTVSQQAKEEILHFHPHIAADKISVAYNAASSDFVPATDEDVVAVKQKYGLSGRYFLFVGTLNPRKNLVNIVEAFARLCEQPGWDHTLLAAAPVDSRYPDFFDLVEGKNLGDRLLLPGYAPKEDLAALYRGATAFLFPSRHESFGLPIVEAFACGTPVVTSTTTAMPEVAGEAALLVDPYKVDEIASAMDSLASDEDLRQALIAKGLQRNQEFSWEQAARRMLAAYQLVAKAS